MRRPDSALRKVEDDRVRAFVDTRFQLHDRAPDARRRGRVDSNRSDSPEERRFRKLALEHDGVERRRGPEHPSHFHEQEAVPPAHVVCYQDNRERSGNVGWKAGDVHSRDAAAHPRPEREREPGAGKPGEAAAHARAGRVTVTGPAMRRSQSALAASRAFAPSDVTALCLRLSYDRRRISA